MEYYNLHDILLLTKHIYKHNIVSNKYSSKYSKHK